MEKGQVNFTTQSTLAIGGVAILGIGYILTTNNFFNSDKIAQVIFLGQFQHVVQNTHSRLHSVKESNEEKYT